jgi:hypothetical protein
VTKYQISAINSSWEKCAYMFNVYRNQLSRQTESRNLTGPKTLPTIWYTYIMLVTKYQISVINSCSYYTPAPWRGRGYIVLPLSVCPSFRPSKIFFVLMAEIWYLVTSIIYHIVGSVLGPVRFLLPVCRLSWSTYMMLVTKYQIPVINRCLEKCG